MSEDTLPKYVLVFALFAVFLLITNLRSNRNAASRRLRSFRHRRRSGAPVGGAPEAEPTAPEDADPEAGLGEARPSALQRLGLQAHTGGSGRRGLWMSLVALAVALLAVVFAWWSRGG